VTENDAIDPTVPPSGEGCVECLATGGWWLHLRRCAHCGHIGCCDSSPSQHARSHAAQSGHPVVRSFEPDEDWFWDYTVGQFRDGPILAAPECRPREQPVPAPENRVPLDWVSFLH
jgi:Zn-finger in ubiquitin-hydrolases and other protein